jgi:uncharacterized repeat protein (TIGR04138 family)
MKLVRSDPRYPAQAYYLIYEGLDYTQRLLERQGHVSGQELAEGIRQMALEQFGLMARTVLASWGIKSTADFGELVFNLVENGLLKKTAEDSREDFKDVYDFSEAFERSFEFEFQGE